MGKQETTVYCPTSVAITEKYFSITPRIGTFDGKKVGLLWNSKPNGDVLLSRIAELLEKNYKDINIIRFWEVDPRGTTFPGRMGDEALDRISNSVDIVIASQGD